MLWPLFLKNTNRQKPSNFQESQLHFGFFPAETEVCDELKKRNEFHLIFLYNEVLGNN